MSPYENRYQLDGFHRIGLFAETDKNSAPDLECIVRRNSGKYDVDYPNSSISNLEFFAYPCEEQLFLFVFLHFSGENPNNASDELASSDKRFGQITELLNSGSPVVPNHYWKRMELINVVATANSKITQSSQRHGVVSRLNLADELTYRTLHQTNWPGVVDQLLRSHYQNWTTFLIERQNALLLFTYFEYIGVNRELDDAAMAADPVTRRWWTHTVPCLTPVNNNDEIWTPMTHFELS